MKRLLGSFAAFAVAANCFAVVLGQSDDFQDGTLQNWSGGAFPTNIPTDGPKGAGDHYLQIHSTLAGGNHLAVRNDVQWGGDYQTAGVTVVEAYLRNEGPTELDIRVVLFGSGGSRFTSVVARVLPADNTWHHVAFPLRSSDLVRVSGTETYSQVIQDCNQLMFRHDPGDPSSNGIAVDGTLGIDDVTASNFATEFPEVLHYTRGSTFSGNIASLFFSDENKLVSRPGAVFFNGQPPIVMELTSHADFSNSTLLTVSLECSANSVQVRQRLSLFNYSANQYIDFDVRNLSSSDTMIEVSTSESAYIGPGGEIKLRLSYDTTGAVFLYPWLSRLDRAVWKLKP